MNLLIPGGAGYIGSHMVKFLQEKNHDVVVLDNFSTGNKWSTQNCEILNVDLLDSKKLSKLLKGRKFDGVIHFAAKSLVGESLKIPDFYYRNNVVGTLNLINEMIRNNNNNLIFSSSAAIFGNPISDVICEDHPKEPINPYGKSKLMVEKIIHDTCKAYQLSATCLRYFNAAGAHHTAEIGEYHKPETHIIPNIIKSLLMDKIFKIYGNDYPTKDGTCIRDYIHVDDLAEAHLLSLENNIDNPGYYEFNLGCGAGYSIFDLIKSCEKVANKKVKYEIHDRRKGDPANLIADINKAKNILGWSPKYKDLDEITASAFIWHKKLINNDKMPVSFGE